MSTNKEYSVTPGLKFGLLNSYDFGTKGIPDCKRYYHFRQGPLLVISEFDIISHQKSFFVVSQFLVISSHATLEILYNLMTNEHN